MKFLIPSFWKKNNLITYFLLPLTLITRLINFYKNFKKKYNLQISTICVGNIYLGGTGKTQLVIKLNKILKNDYDITVIKKYYKDQLDEQKLLSKTSNVILARNRLQEVKKIKKLKKNIAIFDDGLQDKTIKYKISIVCFNSLTAAGNEKMLPAGPLRENLSELKNYDAVFINGKKNKYLINLIKKYNHKIKIFEGKYILKNRKEFKLNKNYIAFCGIGTPDNFFNLLGENRINVQKKIIFPDHYDYKISDMYKLKKLALDKNCQLVTTEKDIMKIKKFKKFKVKYTEVDLKIDNELHLKKFLKNNL